MAMFVKPLLSISFWSLYYVTTRLRRLLCWGISLSSYAYLDFSRSEALPDWNIREAYPVRSAVHKESDSDHIQRCSLVRWTFST